MVAVVVLLAAAVAVVPQTEKQSTDETMKTNCTMCRIRGFTLTELLIVIGAVALVALLLPALAATQRKTARINCVNNLKEIGVAFRVWEGDHGDKYPMQVAMTNSETMKLIASGKAYVLWQTMSNELATPKVLHCPADTSCLAATNFATGFSGANISYFFSLDAVETFPQMILDGDDNLVVDGVRVKPGILNLWPTNSPAWTGERHRPVGNIGMADGSVQQVTTTLLNSAAAAATNGAPANRWRLVIP
jgi:prepilin-type N-terminal cleavage/methylation domain-containing protein/prepilin-type processing-associated H-X9-DG protein